MMGYRSDVVIAFYAHEPEHNGVVSLWLKSNFPYEDWKLIDHEITEQDKPVYSFVFEVCGIKWYHNYPAVVRMRKLIEEFVELFCSEDNNIAACEFMRSGEEDDDIEHVNYGDVGWVLSIEKRIHVNL
jgi:hypothetical protein